MEPENSRFSEATSAAGAELRAALGRESTEVGHQLSDEFEHKPEIDILRLLP